MITNLEVKRHGWTIWGVRRLSYVVFLRQDSDSTVKDRVGQTNGLEATVDNERTKVERHPLPLAGLLRATQKRDQ